LHPLDIFCFFILFLFEDLVFFFQGDGCDSKIKHLVQRKMDVYRHFRAHDLAITAAGAFAGIGDDRHVFLLVPAEYVQGAMFITGATPVAVVVINFGAIINVSVNHSFLL
jgi:hypothetical protein